MMEHTEYAVGQTWHRPLPWGQEWRIVEIDRRASVTFLKVEPHPISGRAGKWISSGLFADEMDKRHAIMQ